MAQTETLDTFWLDGAQTDNLRLFPAQTDIAPLSPIYVGKTPGTLFWDEITYNNFATNPYKYSSSFKNDYPFMVLVLINRTGADLLLVDTALVDGTARMQAEMPLVPPPEELGKGSSSVGVWSWDHTTYNPPKMCLKFGAIPETKNLPIYIAGSVSTPFMSTEHYTVSISNAERGSAQQYFDAFADSGKPDFDKNYSQTGKHIVRGYRYTPQIFHGPSLSNLTIESKSHVNKQSLGMCWLVVAVIDKDLG